jgi:hypothetical protein
MHNHNEVTITKSHHAAHRVRHHAEQHMVNNTTWGRCRLEHCVKQHRPPEASTPAAPHTRPSRPETCIKMPETCIKMQVRSGPPFNAHATGMCASSIHAVHNDQRKYACPKHEQLVPKLCTPCVTPYVTPYFTPYVTHMSCWGANY